MITPLFPFPFQGQSSTPPILRGGVDLGLRFAGFDPVEIRESREGVTVFFKSWCDLVRAWRELGGFDLSNTFTGFVLFFPD